MSPEQCNAPECAQCALPSVRTLNTVRYETFTPRLDPKLTGKALPIFGVLVKVISVSNHATSQMRHGESLFLVITLVALRDRFDIGCHRLVNTVDA